MRLRFCSLPRGPSAAILLAGVPNSGHGGGGMSKVKKSRRKKFNYNLNRKKLKKKMRKKEAPRIACEQIRNAWDDSKSVARNMAEMGLSFDPNKTLPIRQEKVTEMKVNTTQPSRIIRKPYVLEGLQAEASLPEKSSRGISSDMVEYVQYMIKNHGKNYKEMARDEKNYYQDTPKQIQRKIELYQRYHPDDFQTLSAFWPHGDINQQ